MTPTRPCSTCGVPTISRWVWEEKWTQAQRKAALADGLHPYASHGLCRACKSRKYRYGDPSYRPPAYKPPSRTHSARSRPMEDVLEDWDMIWSSVGSINEAADRMGMNFHTLDKQLYRARKLGDPRGSAHGRQRLRTWRTSS